MSKVFKNSPQQSKLILEELEERRLFSGGIEGLIASDLEPEAQAIYADADKAKAANANDETSASVAEQQSQEIVFIDAGVDNYQQLVDDIHNNADSSRNIEVVVLDRDKDGIEEISEFLSHRENLDAIHIISHGSDGSVELGNTSLNADTLEQNNLKIALWANNFADTGDILIYGCSLAETEVGQSLIADLGALTLTDVAASDDLTGAAALGGDWELEHSAGSIEAQMAISIAGQQQWAGVLTNFTVDTLLDTNDVTPGNGVAEDISGNTSIRAAIEEANALAGADTITIGAGTFTLSGGQLVISSDVTITGAGPGLTIIDGASIDRVFEIVNNATVTLEGMTITGGGNVVSGGGISVSTGNTLTLVNAVLTGNDASQGGAIYNNRNLIMDRVSVISNTAGIGGGLFNSNTATITNSLFCDNTASNDGGGIWVDGNGTSLTLTNTTLSGNTADTGGGLFSGSLATLTNVTITDNTATTNGGGIAEGTGTVTTELLNTIVAGNTSPTGSDIDGSIDSLGFNIIGEITDSSGWTVDDQQDVDPLLGALADNGGPTLTHALLASSTAINAGDPGTTQTFDQRGLARDGSTDIGAFEFGAANVAPVFIDRSVGNWNFDEGSGTTTDDSAYGTSTGTLNGATWTTGGKFGDALQFDGVDDYVEIVDAPELDISGPEFSASLWVKPDRGPGTEDMFFMKGDRQGIGNVNYYLSWKDSGKMTWAFKSDGGFEYIDIDVTLPTVDEWNHVAVVFDRPTVSIYINGTEYTGSVGTGGTSMDKDLVANDDPLWIGAGRSGGSIVTPGNYSAPFSGAIDELALFDRALTAAEIEAIRTSAPPVVTASAFNIDENSANDTVVGTVVANDQDVGDTLSYAITAGNTGGAFSIDANGQIKVANSAVLDFETNPVFTLTIEATDDGSPNLSDTTTVTIALNEVNETPTAVDDAFVVNEDTPTNIDLLANDTDPENDTLTLLGFERVVASYDAGTSGSAVDPASVAGGSWLFEDTEDANAASGNLQSSDVSPDGAAGQNAWNIVDGSDAFGENLWYSTTLSLADATLADTNGWSLSSEIRLVDDFDDTRTTFIRYGDGTTRFLAYFDLDSNNDLTVELIDDGGNQLITLTDDGSGSVDYHHYEIVYDPNTSTAMFLFDGVRVDGGGWSGEASTNEGVRWGMGSGSGQASANYHSIDMKVFDQSITTANGATVTNNGDGTVNYDPAQNFTGADSFSYTIRDSEGHLDTATVNVTVDAVNDDPVITSDGSGAVAAINVAENTTSITTVTANDVDLDTVTFSITGGADQGLFTILPTGELSFLLAPDFEGAGDNSYEVEITAADGNGGFDVQTITVTVTDVYDGVIRVTPLSLAPLAGETLVNTGNTDNQAIHSGVSQALATDANGNYVIVWSSNLQDGAGWGIYAQLFNADGTARGSEIPINATTADSQLSASVAMDAAGNFVVTWQSNLQDGDGYGIFARAFNAAGVAQGGEIPVNTYTTGYQGAPGIAMAANGDFVIQWASSVQDPDGSYGIYAQRFNAAGAVQGGEFRVNTYIPGYQQVSSISMDDAGNFVVTWGSQGQDGSSYGVFGQIFNADGSPRGPEFQANTTTQYSQLYNDVAMLPDGRFVVAYQSANADTSTDLFIQAFNADGSKHGVEIQVNAVSDMDYFPIPSISADASGNFTVVWNNSNDGALSGVFMRSYDWDGNALSGEVQVNTTTAGEQLYPEIVAQPGGGLIVAWSGNGTGDADGVFTQRYGLSTDEDGNSTTFQLVLEHAPTADVIIPVSVSDGSEGTVSTGSVTFTSANWNTPQIVTVTGVQDFILDDDQTFTVNIGPATSTDLNFNGLDPADLIVTNHETNTPPVITSDGGGATVSINVAENTTAVTTVTATDADLDTPTFTITGGADQGLFSIDLNSGLLTFDTPPNFEGPGDNSYTVEVTAADGFGGIDVQTINVSVTNVNEAPVANADSANLVFDGDDIVQVADHASLQMSNNLTMEAWFNYSSSGTGSQLILNKEGEYELGVIADTGEIQFAITQSDNTWSWHRTGVFVNPDEWAHVAVTYDGTAGEAKTYINGELVDTYLQSGNIGDVYTAYDDLFIGGRENDADERFNGQIDEVRIWDTTRSQTDIQNNYSDKLTGAEPGLAGYWRLNEADGTLVADMSANNNDGTLGGAEGAASTPTYDGYFTDQNTTLVIAAVDGVLANDFDADGDSLAVTNLDTTGMLGTLNLNAADGGFSYDPNGAFDYLDAGEIAYETFTYTANDSSLDSNVVSVTITVVGTEDAAVVGGTVTGAVSEDGTLTSSDNLTITDADTSDNPVTFNDVAATLGDSGYGDFEITGNAWTYTLNNAHPALQALDVGETLTDTHSFTATDGSTQQVTITINGAEDAPVFDSTAIIVATEDVAYSYTITTSDVDIENVTITAPTLPAWLTFVDNGNGTATLSGTPGNAEVGNHNVVLNVSDGTLNSNQNFTITVSNTNDPAVIGGTDTGAVQEDVAVVANNISTSGTLTITDPDTGESSFQAATITGTYGDLVMQTNGNWTYTADNTQAAIQQLDVSEFITDTLTVTSFDGTTHNVVITINGSEDAAVISGTTTGSVTEDGTLTSSGALTITDTDTSDTPSFADVTSTGGDNGYGNFVMTAGTWTYTLDNNAAAVQALDVGETLTDTHTFTATDGSTQQVTITINGAEDTPVFDSTAITAATEDLAYSYTITTSDVDVENVTITAPTLPAWLTFVDNGNGTATLSGTPTNAEVGNHNVVLTVSDGTLNSNQNFTIIVANTNDPAVIGGADTGAVQEDVAVVANNISTTGALTITDPDTGESTFQAGTAVGTYGSLTIDTAGNWTYTADNTQPAIQQLDALESMTDTLTVTSFDGTTHNVVITINGSEDAAVISGTTTGSVTEDGTLTSSGALTITDTDTSDTPSFADVTSTGGDNGYGNFVMTAGTWTYTLDNNDAAVQALDVGETLTDTHSFTATDGSTQQVTVTINGAEDTPVFDSTAITAATEDLAYSYTITTSDVDIETVTITAPTLPAWLTFVDNGNGTATLSGTPTNAEVGNHNVVLNVSDGTLSSNQNFTIIVANTNDPAVIGGADTGAVQEDVGVVANNISTSGTLTIADPDSGESSFLAATINGTYGDLTIDSAGNWTYTSDNTQAAIQQLDALESITDTLTVTSFDGTTHNVVITINGAEDAAVISGTTTGSVTEDGTLTSSGALTITDTDTSDTPGFADVGATAGDNGYGSFVMASGTWTYTLDNNDPAVQALDVSETLTDTHTFTATDGSTQVVTVTINGAEDAPAFDSTAVTAATEDVAYSYTITTSDVDIETVTITAPTLPGWLTFVDNGNGTATLSGTPGNAEVGNHNVVLNVSDGTLSSNQNFTVVVSNTNDPAVIAGTDTGAVQEDVAVVANNISTTGTLTITDPDTGESTFQAGTAVGAYGSLTIDTAGNWTYTADNTQAAIQQLDISESLTDTLTVTSFDGTTHNVVITINGSEDAAVISGTITGSVTEDGTLTSSGTLTISDTDDSDTPAFADVTSTAGDNAYGNFVMTAGTWTYTLDNNDAAVQALDVGETLTDTHTFTATDGSTQVVTVTINGAEDTPVFDSTAITAATEDLAYSYTITTSDVDVENVTITAPTLPAWLSFVDNGNGTATLSGTPTNAEVGSHNVVLNVSDGTLNSNQNFTIVVSNTNDAAVIGGTDTGAVQEDVAVVANNISTSGTLTIADPDAGESSFQSATINGTYGDLTIDTAGNWTYTADNTQVAIQQLDALESITDTLTVTSFDGTTHNVVITINGSEDAAVISGTITGSVTEDGTLTSSGTLTISDTDDSDTPAFADVTSTAGDNAYGNFVMTAGTWTYTLDNNDAAVQALDVGETLTDTHTFTATDGSTQVVTVTINGAEDTPVFDSTAITAATEDLAYSYTITTSDVDVENVTITAPTLPAWLSFVDNGNGTATLSGTPTNAEVGSHNVVLNVSDGTLNSNQNFTIVVSNTNDAAVIGGTDTGAVQEDVAVVANNISTSGTLTIADPDAGESSFQSATINGTYGDLTIDTAGNWTYTADNTQVAIQQLDVLESITDTLTVTSFDGTTHNVVITINGSEDAGVITGTTTGSVTEDGTLTSSGALTITDTDTSDTPAFADVTSTGGDNGYGNFIMTAGTWTYTLDNSNPAVQALDVSETLTDTHTFTATDGSTQVVTVTINGAEDTPVFDSTAVTAATEDVAYSYTITTSDVDIETVTITAPTLPAWLTFGDNGNGTATLSGTPGNAEVGNHNVVLNVSDGTLSSNQNFTITVSNINDPAVIGGTDTGAVQEDVAVVANNISTTGTLTITDPDTGESSFQAATITGTYGDLVMQTNGNWTYTADNTQAAIQQLDALESITDTLTVTSFDGTTHNVVITINGSEDTAVISGTTTGSVTEDGTLTSSGALSITDTDTSDTPSFADVGATAGDNGYGSFVMTSGTWTYTLDNSNPAVQALDVTETLSDTHTFTATDGSTQQVTITINGAEDTPVFDSTAIIVAIEDVAYSYTITTSDVDVENVTITAPTLPAWLTFVDNGNGTATLSGTPGNAEVGNHNVLLNVSDGTLSSNQNFTIVVANANDPAVIGGADTGAVTEDVGVLGGMISTTGSLTIADPDSGESSFQPTTITGSYGDLTIDTAGNWIYSATNNQAAIQALDAGQSMTDTLTVSAFDGTTHDVVITINGSEDGSVVGGTAVGAVVEDGTLIVSDTLTITDVDSSDNPISFSDVTPTPGINGYGNFEMSGNIWTYTLNNSHAAVQALDVGEILTDLFTFSASDGSTQVITITINGAEDTPLFDSSAVTAATEDVVYSYTVTTRDADVEAVTITAPTLPAWLTFVDNGDGTATLAGTPTNAEVGSHNVVLSVSDGSLSSNQSFTIIVANTDDAPVIGGVDSGQVSEDEAVSGGKIATSGALTIADPDAGESSFVGSTINGALGALTIDTAGNWRYSADNGNPEIQALQSGESISETLTVTTADGSTHNVVITIHGAAEASVTPPPPVEPPTIESPPEEEPPPVEEETVDDGTGQGSIVDDIVRAPQDVTPPPVQEVVDNSGYLQQEQAEADKARYSDQKDKPAVKIMELPQAQAIQQQAIQQQNLSLDELSFQVSDDETLNEKYELELLARIDSMHSGMDGDAAQTSADDVDVQIVMGSTASLTAGIVSWVLRGGSLLASFMSTVPLLNRFDPLPILKSREEKEDVEEDADDGDADTKFKQHQKRVDKLFSAKDNAREQDGYMND